MPFISYGKQCHQKAIVNEFAMCASFFKMKAQDSSWTTMVPLLFKMNPVPATTLYSLICKSIDCQVGIDKTSAL